LEDIEIEEGNEIGKFVSEYDYKNRVVSQKRYTREFLIEEIHTEYIENTTITSRIENGIVIERSIEKEYDNGTKLTEFYEFGVMFEIQEESYIFEANTYVIKVMNVDHELLSTIAEQVDDHGVLLSNHKISADGKPISESVYTLENDKLVQVTLKDHIEGKEEIHRYSYDECGNVAEIVIEDITGNKIAFHSSLYNEVGTLMEEKGFGSSYFSTVKPHFLHSSVVHYHLIHEYED